MKLGEKLHFLKVLGLELSRDGWPGQWAGEEGSILVALSSPHSFQGMGCLGDSWTMEDLVSWPLGSNEMGMT